MNTLEDLIFTLSEGIPGVIDVLVKLIKMGRLDLVVKLQTNNITGESIWGIYKDQCNQDINKFIEYINAN